MTRAYLQHGEGAGPFLTESVEHRRDGFGQMVRYDGAWRRVRAGAGNSQVIMAGGRFIAVTLQESGE